MMRACAIGAIKQDFEQVVREAAKKVCLPRPARPFDARVFYMPWTAGSRRGESNLAQNSNPWLRAVESTASKCVVRNS